MNIIIILLRICHVEKLLVWHKALLHVRGIKFIAQAEIVLFFVPLAATSSEMSEIPLHRKLFLQHSERLHDLRLCCTKTGTVYVNYNMALLPIQ